MRKLLILLMIAMLTLSLTACNTNEKPESTNPPAPTRPTYENADEYTLTFTNEGMSLDLPWERLSAAIQGKHKDATMMSEAIQANKEYYANLIKVKIAVYNYEDLDDTGVQTTLDTNISLLNDADVTVCTQYIETSGYIGNKYPIERLHQMQRLGFEKYGIQITCIYKIGYGDASSEFKCTLNGKAKFDDKTSREDMQVGKLVLTNTGAELTAKTDDILSACKLDTAAGDVRINVMSPVLYTSKQQTSIGTMDILTESFSAENKPEELLFKLKYDRAWSNNTALYKEYTEIGQEMYMECQVTVLSGENEDIYTFYLMCDVESKLSEVEPVDADPMTEVTWEQSYVKLDNAMPFILYAPTGVELTANTPMVIWLHGSGECGASEATYLTRGLPAVLDTWEMKEFNAYIVCPICPSSSWTNPSYTEDLQVIIDYMTTHFPVNPENISLAGHSLGGIGVQYFGGKMPDTFVRIAVLSGYSCDQLSNITAPIRGWVGCNGEDGSSYAYMMREDIVAKMSTTVIDCGHGALPQQVFTIDENQDGFSDVFMWLCGVE